MDNRETPRVISQKRLAEFEILQRNGRQARSELLACYKRGDVVEPGQYTINAAFTESEPLVLLSEPVAQQLDAMRRAVANGGSKMTPEERSRLGDEYLRRRRQLIIDATHAYKMQCRRCELAGDWRGGDRMIVDHLYMYMARLAFFAAETCLRTGMVSFWRQCTLAGCAEIRNALANAASA